MNLILVTVDCLRADRLGCLGYPKKITPNIDYLAIPSLSNESREKLHKIRPVSLGQAARISGVRHSDITILMIFLEKYFHHGQKVSRETT